MAGTGVAKVGLVAMQLEKGGREAEAEADARNGTKDLVRFVPNIIPAYKNTWSIVL